MFLKLPEGGEGNFDAQITKSTNKIGNRVQLRFRIVQHERDIKLMENIVNYLGAGKIYKYPHTPAVCLTIVKFTDICNIIIPFFNKNPIYGPLLLLRNNRRAKGKNRGLS